MGKMIKLSPKSRRKLITVFLVVFVLFCVFAVNNSIYFQKENEKPMLKYAQDGSYIEYKGRIYKSFGFNSHSYEFTTYKKLAKVDAFISIYSLINDEEENFCMHQTGRTVKYTPVLMILKRSTLSANTKKNE